jgi:hypothetical protein
MVTGESEAERFWLGHDMDNYASARGIAKAGFRETGVVFRRLAGGFVLIPREPLARAAAAAELFGLEVVGRAAGPPTR